MSVTFDFGFLLWRVGHGGGNLERVVQMVGSAPPATKDLNYPL